MEANSLVQHPVKRGRFERRLCPDDTLHSVDGRLRKAASLAQTSPLGTEGERHSACGQIRSLKRLASDSCFVPGFPSHFGFCCLPRRIQPPFYGAPYLESSRRLLTLNPRRRELPLKESEVESR